MPNATSFSKATTVSTTTEVVGTPGTPGTAFVLSADCLAFTILTADTSALLRFDDAVTSLANRIVILPSPSAGSWLRIQNPNLRGRTIFLANSGVAATVYILEELGMGD